MSRKRAIRVCLVILVVALVIAPTVYVLSIGPAHSLMDYGYISELTFFAVYGSFIARVKTSPRLQKIVVWYIDLWVMS